MAGEPPAGILAAAGIGERARSALQVQPKQFRHLGGRPIFMWAFHAMVDAGCDPIVIAAPPPLLSETRAVLGEEKAVTVAGGASRQESIARALEVVDSEFVVIHDAARPFASVELIRRVIEAVQDHSAVIAGLPMSDTVKRVSDGLVVETLDRSPLWRSQTPAAFRTEVLKKAHELAASDGFVGTDESQLLERYGLGPIAVVEGETRNIKITWPEDFLIADAIAVAGT